MPGERTVFRMFLNDKNDLEYQLMTEGIGIKDLHVRILGLIHVLSADLAKQILEDGADDMDDNEVSNVRKLLDK